jgi:hypothetical protein
MSRNHDKVKDLTDKNTDIDAAVRDLFKKQVTDVQAFKILRSKYKDEDIIDRIFNKFQERHNLIINKAQSFRHVLYTKYKEHNLPYAEFIRKARKYRNKYNMANEEFTFFVHLASDDNSINRTNYYNLPNTPMSKALGYTSTFALGNQLQTTEQSDVDIIKKIVELHVASRRIHRDVFIQSIIYTSCAPEVVNPKPYDSNKHNALVSIHSIIAALFIPKIQFLEERMLYANIAGMITNKWKSVPIQTHHDHELYLDLVTDPMEIGLVKNPFKSLEQRVKVQIELWENIIRLRQGLFYYDRADRIIAALNDCSRSYIDAPDLALIQDEGTLLRRLLNVFSIRPILVSLSQIQMSPFTHTEFPQVTTVPMITLRIPLNIFQPDVATTLDLLLSNPQLYIEHKHIVHKQQLIVASRGAIFFHVPRRCHNFSLISKLSFPFSFTHLPLSVTGTESVNDRPLHFKTDIKVMDDIYDLQSVVTVETAKHIPEHKNVIIGSAAYILRDPQTTDYKYFPQGVLIPNGNNVQTCAITQVSRSEMDGVDNTTCLMYHCSRYGTIFVYIQNKSCLSIFGPQ